MRKRLIVAALLIAGAASAATGPAGEDAFNLAEDHGTAAVIAPATCVFDATKQMLVVDATNGAQVCSLPACNSTTGVTREVTLVKADTSANAVSFAPNGTDKITGVNANLSVGTSQGNAVNLRCLPNVTGLPAGWWRH